ncbi:MAG TPA: hypothetical protein VHY22_03380 [Chthoniobacteraceae bacterium]|jgi:hypothetical protein|nr:hypothetical protein [Chthoniobacteraceae bacterium]
MKSPAISLIQNPRPSRIPAALGVMMLIFAVSAPAMANTKSFITGTAADLGAAGAYTSGSLPGTSSDVVFASGTSYTNASSLSVSTASLSIGTMNDANSASLTVSEGNGQTLTLNGGSNSFASGDGGTANDDVFVAAGGTMNLSVATTIASGLTSAYIDNQGTLALGLTCYRRHLRQLCECQSARKLCGGNGRQFSGTGCRAGAGLHRHRAGRVWHAGRHAALPPLPNGELIALNHEEYLS